MYLPMVRKIGAQSQVWSYQRLKKWYLMLPCLTLSIIRCISRVTRAILGKNLCPTPHLGAVIIEKGAFRLPSTTVGQPIYIYIYINVKE